MTDTPWTPGPWEPVEEVIEFDDGPNERYWFVRPVDPSMAARINPATSVPREADARLIAVAPEMAELLEVLSWWHRIVGTATQDEADAFSAAVDEAHALLGRIRGES